MRAAKPERPGTPVAIHAHRWTPAEVSYLTAHANEGAQAVADALGRSVRSVECAASRYRVSLRRRWMCPRCSRVTYVPLSAQTGWCRTCTIEESRDVAVMKYREVMREIGREQARILEAKRARQAVYSDTDRKKNELRRLRGEREEIEKRPAIG